MGWELLLTQFSSCSIACGTDVSATNFIGKTVIYLADIKDRNFDGTSLCFWPTEIINLLCKHGGKTGAELKAAGK
tara:strand:+ start:261 stop:485 length:225 start_codon:yes stop_codon:yes gene_type:complete